MKQVVFWTGRSLQLAGLMLLPSAIWVGLMERNERGSIGIFVGSTAIFYLGYFLTRVTAKL